MRMRINQKLTAPAKVVPLLWRDCAWRIHIFVRIRIGAQRPMAIGPHLASREIAGLPGLKIWTTPRTRSGAGVSPATRSAVFRLQHPQTRPEPSSGSGVPPVAWGVAPRFMPRSGAGVSPATQGVPPRFTAAKRFPGLAGKWGRGGPRPYQVQRHRRSRTFLQPESCIAGRLSYELRRKQAVERLQPVLAFASSQLGGIAPSQLRIYSVFE
jgi:hypothetical protein